MIGGMITAPILSMLVLPAAYLLLHRREMRCLYDQRSSGD
jgi:Cu(I)/Ag(I) efflux system membrane protein CusA/SilA